jgi:predicted HAD superfamily Cof-like phosphohydrolase
MVNKMQQQVADFHRAMGQPVGHSVRALPQERKAVRIELIREEFLDELIPALEADDVVETVDALVELGVDAEIIFNEVQRSNMSKFGADGKPIIAGPNDPDGVFEGRVKKGPNYFKPDIGGLLASGHADLDIAAATAVH